ncbi:MAG: hypothetical protein GY911_13315 [Actinomycetales bacterium]|nr:hypothetical protein [Actinomycetales bacterium]
MINAVIFVTIVAFGTIASVVYGFIVSEQMNSDVPPWGIWLMVLLGVIYSFVIGALICGLFALLLTSQKDFQRIAAASESSAESMIAFVGTQARLGEAAAKNAVASERLSKAGEAFAKAHLAIAKELHTQARDRRTESSEPVSFKNSPVRPKR